MNKHSSVDIKEYNEIITSLAVTFTKARHIKLLQSLTIENFQDIDNVLLLLNNGQITCSQKDQELTVTAGDILFIPGGKPITITYGHSGFVTLHNKDFAYKPRKYFQTMPASAFTAQFANFSYVTFEARVFNTANLFTYFGIPAFVIKGNTPLHAILRKMLAESNSEAVGSSRMCKVYAEQLVIEIVRHLIEQNLFTKSLATHIHYFNNPRIISLLTYIQKNLHNDLSNRILATVANVAEDYVGQLFKRYTDINPQSYIEHQRMEQAVKLLRTTQKSVNDISRAVGFKDTAYFCRRFKMKFGIPAGKLRSREMTV
ncbi:MAG: helix-turn-helix domain-containing protein [Bacteroidota bacterium]